MKKSKRWIKMRHRVLSYIASLVLFPYVKIKYGISIEKMHGKQQCLILYNHQTPFDQFFIGMAYHGSVYYLATEDIFSNGFISSLLRFAVAPIPIKKQTTDPRAVMNCIKVAKEGGTLAIAPEGNRTYSGKTEYINPAIASLAKKLDLPIAFFRIEGGYGVQPRWSDKTRKGKMKCYFSKILQPEEFKNLNTEELYSLICRELYVNEASVNGEFFSKKSAEYLERAIYVCPKCGFSKFHSVGDRVSCTGCGINIRYLPTKELEGIGFDFPFRFVNDWYEYQNDYVQKFDADFFSNKVLFNDICDIYRVEVYRKKVLIGKDVKVSLFTDRVELDMPDGKKIIGFDRVNASAVMGRNKLNIFHFDDCFQFKGGKRFNALKYVNLFYRYRNKNKGAGNERFLGL